MADRDSRASLRPRRNSAGFSLLEVMIALGILAVGLLAMLTMQIYAMRHGNVGRHYTQAAQFAQQQMELFHRVAAANPVVADTGGWVLGGAVQNAVVQNATLGGGLANESTYTLDWRVTQDASAGLRHIDVRVTWREPDDPPAAPLRRYAVSSVRYDQGWIP